MGKNVLKTYYISANKFLKLEHNSLPSCNWSITPCRKSLLCCRHCSFKFILCGQWNLRNNFLRCLKTKVTFSYPYQKELNFHKSEIEKRTYELVTHWVYDIYKCWGLRINKSPSYEIRNPLVQNKRIKEIKSKREIHNLEINIIRKCHNWQSWIRLSW